jgi:hypothetical protein
MRQTLVIGGKEDIFTPVWMAEEVANGIPGPSCFYTKSWGMHSTLKIRKILMEE